MNAISNSLLAAAVALGAATLLDDFTILRDLATFFALGGVVGGAVVYRAERRGRELSALQVRQILFRWAAGGAILGLIVSAAAAVA